MRVSAAQAKSQLAALVAQVAFGRQRVVIERRGKPMAALVSVQDLDLLEQGHVAPERGRGALALVGAWRELADEDLDSLVSEIYAAREQDTGRAVDLDG